MALILPLLVQRPMTAAPETVDKSYLVPRQGRLLLRVPATWAETAVSENPLKLVTFALPAGTGSARVSLAPPSGLGDGPSLERLNRATTMVREGLKDEARDGVIKKRSISGGKNRGNCLTYEKAVAGPGGLSRHVRCAVLLGSWTLNVVTDYADATEEVIERVLEIAATASLEPLTEYELRAPGADWRLLVPVEGFNINSASGPTKMLASHPTNGVTLSAFLEPGYTGATAEKCREAFTAKLSRSPLPMSGPQDSEYRGMALHEYTLEKVEGIRVQQRHIHAHLARADVCIEVHVSKVGFREKHRVLLTQLLDQIRLVDEDGR